MRKNINYIGLKEQHSTLRNQIIRSVNSVLNDSMFILSKQLEEFEKTFAEYVGAKYCVGVNSGTDSLFLSMKALGINQYSSVITAPNSFLATASSIVATGARPIFVDVSEDMNINPDLIEDAIEVDTIATIPVHLTGRPAKMNKIMRIAEDKGLYVIEDCAQAIGTKFKDKHVGTFGDIGCFSFHPLKTLNACGDGGAIVTNSKRIYDKLLQLRNIGLKDRDHADLWGYNSRLDTLQASILLTKMKYVNYWVEKRRNNAKIYSHNLKNIVNTPKETKDEYSTYHTYIIKTENRNHLQSYLKDNRIRTAIHYPIPIHLQKCAQSLGYKKGDFPETEKQADTILSLPIYPELKIEEIMYVIEMIKKWKDVF